MAKGMAIDPYLPVSFLFSIRHLSYTIDYLYADNIKEWWQLLPRLSAANTSGIVADFLCFPPILRMHRGGIISLSAL